MNGTSFKTFLNARYTHSSFPDEYLKHAGTPDFPLSPFSTQDRAHRYNVVSSVIYWETWDPHIYPKPSDGKGHCHIVAELAAIGCSQSRMQIRKEPSNDLCGTDTARTTPTIVWNVLFLDFYLE